MAFTLAQASQGSGTFPLPLAPQLRAAYRRALPRRIAAALLVWSLLFSVGFATLFILLLTDAGERIGFEGPERWIAICVVPLLCGLLAVTVGRDLLQGVLVRVLGYCRATMPSAGGPFSRAPETVRGASPGLLAAAAAVSAPVGLLCMLLIADPRPWAIATGAVSALAVAVLFGLLAMARLRSAVTGWREESRRAAVADRLRLEGEHAVAVVAEAVFTRNWIDGVPVFRIRAEFPHAAGTRQLAFGYVEFPRWAPLAGNEFDLWFDPEQPENPDRIVLERRLVGQEFADDAESFRRPSQGGDGPAAGPIEPRWAGAMRGLAPSQRIAYGCGFIFGVAAILCLAVTAAAWFLADDPPWWVVTSIVGALLPPLLGLWLCLRPAVSPRAVIRSTAAELLPVSIGVLGTTTALLLAGEAVWALIDSEPFTGMAGGLGVLAIFGAVLGGMFALFGGVAFETPLAVALASNPRVSAELVHEALRSGDPEALPRLERDHGYTAGPLHLHH